MKNTVLITFTLSATLLATGQVLAQPAVQSWMSQEVGAAWLQGYQGLGVTIKSVDDFKSNDRFYGKLNGRTRLLGHGQWTSLQANLIAPQATMRSHDFMRDTTVKLSTGFNVLNLSYGMMAPAGESAIQWSRQESSIIGYAFKGQAVVSKAAGNEFGTAVGQPDQYGEVDYLNRSLIGAKSAIFVGALDNNGSPSALATMASYSNVAGSNTTVQNQFLVVGVEGHKTELYGTSFAAPIVSGYAAILSSKFTKANPIQIANQLLVTARKDTVSKYDPAIHGRGEASITRALAPASIK